GAMWHRPQFAWNLRSPSIRMCSSGCVVALGTTANGAASLLPTAQMAEKNKTASATDINIFFIRLPSFLWCPFVFSAPFVFERALSIRARRAQGQRETVGNAHTPQVRISIRTELTAIAAGEF